MFLGSCCKLDKLLGCRAKQHDEAWRKSLDKKCREESALISSPCEILTKLLSKETQRHFSKRCMRLPYGPPLASAKPQAQNLGKH